MRIFLTGVSCVGKSTLGKLLAETMNYTFFDLDDEIEKYFGEPLGRLQSRYITNYSFRSEIGAAVLKDLLFKRNISKSVIALPPSGLRDVYLRTLRKVADGIVVAIEDTPYNILQRIVFFDIDSKPLHMELSEKDRRKHFQEIKKDITYFNKTYLRAHLHVDIAGLSIEESATKLENMISAYISEKAT
jgi:shikimate kinase